MKILLTGASGQLGTELIPLLSGMGSVYPVDLDCGSCISPECRKLDLTDRGALETTLNRLNPELIVNAGAYTAVDRSEEEPRLAFDVNAESPGRIGRWAARNGAYLIHVSTDYVFDGRSEHPYLETDEPNPLNVYGESKLAGEKAIQASGCRHLILRTSWVYSAHGSNFVLSMLKLGRRKLELGVVNDQVGCPTWARNLAGAIVKLARAGARERSPANHGLLHYSDADPVSWFGFASMVFENAVSLGLLDQAPRLNSIGSSQFPQPATRPAYSVLDTTAVRAHGIVPAPLAASLKACMEELDRV